jgi:hypothetical protein
LGLDTILVVAALVSFRISMAVKNLENLFSIVIGGESWVMGYNLIHKLVIVSFIDRRNQVLINAQ